MAFMFLSVSKPAPNWEGSAVIHGEFKQLKLSDYRGKYLVLLFYPLDL
jgi:peroxiredoxin (alkyl hydroperoxide reductase subunit C)